MLDNWGNAKSESCFSAVSHFEDQCLVNGQDRNFLDMSGWIRTNVDVSE